MSVKDLQEVQAGLAEQLKQQKLLPEEDVRSLLRLPSPERVQDMSIIAALAYMMALDVGRAFRVAKLRRRALAFSERFTTLGGLLRTSPFRSRESNLHRPNRGCHRETNSVSLALAAGVSSVACGA